VRQVFGIQPVREAIRAHGAKLTQVLVEDGDHPQLLAVARFARDHGAPVASVSRGELDRKAAGIRHQGVMALAPELRLLSLADLVVPPDALLLALDEIQDPQNFGAVVRSAVAFGAHAIVWPEHASAPLSASTFRASAGAIEHATLCRVPSLIAAIGELSSQGVRAIGLDAAGEVGRATRELTGASLLVIGSEGKGLKRSVRRACQETARLVMTGPIGSLNASVAAALTLYEATRQRRFPNTAPR
jgi:23S rRNA (guanosine2251-2'-O)-methyltransferase